MLCTSFIFQFGATMEFSDRELSPDPSCSDGSSVEFVVKTPGPDWEDDPSTIVLSDNEEGPPKPKKKMLTSTSCLLLVVLCPSGELYRIASLQAVHQPAQLTMLTQVQVLARQLKQEAHRASHS